MLIGMTHWRIDAFLEVGIFYGRWFYFMGKFCVAGPHDKISWAYAKGMKKIEESRDNLPQCSWSSPKKMMMIKWHVTWLGVRYFTLKPLNEFWAYFVIYLTNNRRNRHALRVAEFSKVETSIQWTLGSQIYCSNQNISFSNEWFLKKITKNA